MNFIDSIGIREYLRQEIDSCLKILRYQGFNVYSFAYAFGATSQELIDSLKTRFIFQRGAIYNKTDFFHRQKRPLNKWNNIYINQENQCYSEAMGIDKIFGNSMALVKPGIDKCKNDSTIMLLYAHKIVKNMPKDYQLDINTLDSILSYADKEGVKFLRCQYLNNYQ